MIQFTDIDRNDLDSSDWDLKFANSELNNDNEIESIVDESESLRALHYQTIIDYHSKKLEKATYAFWQAQYAMERAESDYKESQDCLNMYEPYARF
jgi:hypothetical protein